MRAFTRLVLLAAVISSMASALGSGCSDDAAATAGSTQPSGSTGSGSSGSSGSSGEGGAASSGSGSSGTTDGGVPPPPTQKVPCEAQTYQCGDLIDNDNDGLVDYQDPDCLGPCDNTEDSYYGGIPGQAGPACTVDCYFDNDSGSGNDDCYWNHKCDKHEVAPDYYPEPENGSSCKYDANANTPGTPSSCQQLNQTQSKECHDTCDPLTPNGCDCFGCCELPAGSGKFVFLGSVDKVTKLPSCTIAGLADPDKCHPCTPVDACLNGCGVCELCLGKTQLPPECFPDAGTDPDGGAGGAPPGQCPPGIQPCGLDGQAECPANSYCITGCCQPVPS